MGPHPNGHRPVLRSLLDCARLAWPARESIKPPQARASPRPPAPRRGRPPSPPGASRLSRLHRLGPLPQGALEPRRRTRRPAEPCRQAGLPRRERMESGGGLPLLEHPRHRPPPLVPRTPCAPGPHARFVPRPVKYARSLPTARARAGRTVRASNSRPCGTSPASPPDHEPPTALRASAATRCSFVLPPPRDCPRTWGPFCSTPPSRPEVPSPPGCRARAPPPAPQ